MDAAPFPPARLRVSRHPPPDLSSMPGPSSVDPAPAHNADYEQPSSRTPAAPRPSSANGRSPEAMRLRDLLDQTSSPSSDARHAATPPRPYAPSDRESDYDDIPYFGAGGPSLARESLKALFNSALADTPERTRRGNGDASDMDMSPGPSRPPHQRNWSISDDGSEAEEVPSKAPLRPTPGRRQATEDDRPTPRPELKNLLVSDTESDDTATAVLRHLDSPNASPPEASSTPFHSIHMSPNDSNLLDQDSEMQRAMQDFDSYTASAHNSPMPFPSKKQPERLPPTTPSNPPDDANGQQTVRRPKTSIQSSLDQLLQRSSPRPNLGAGQSFSGRRDREDHDKDKSLNRSKPTPRPNPPTTPALKRRSVNLSDMQDGSPVTNGHPRALSRRASSTSLRSDITSPGSSRRGSVMSNADYQDRRRSMDREQPSEREQGWSKARPHSENLSHFNLSQLDERSRALSSPSRPGSSMSLTLEHHVRSRHRLSAGSSFGDFSSRSASPSNSMFSVDEEREEIIQAVEHERERNWGSNRPQWHARRTSETLLSSRPPSPSSSTGPSGSPRASPALIRRRTESLRSATASPAAVRRSPSSASLRPSTSTQPPLRSPSPSPGQASKRNSFLQANASSPRFRTPSPMPGTPSRNSPSTLRAKRASRDLSDFSTDSARSTGSAHATPSFHSRTYSTPGSTGRPSSRLSLSGSNSRTSQIPVYSPSKKKKPVPVPTPVVPQGEDFSITFPSASRRLPKIEVSTTNGGGEPTSSDAEDNATPRLQEENTPTLKTVLPPAEETPRGSPVEETRSPRLRPATTDEARLQRTVGSPLSVETPVARSTTPPSPPPKRSTTPSPPPPASPPRPSSPDIPTSPEMPSSPAMSTSPEPRPPSRMRASPSQGMATSSPPLSPRPPSRPATPKETSRLATPKHLSRPSTPKEASRPASPRPPSRSGTPKHASRPSTPKQVEAPSESDVEQPSASYPSARQGTPDHLSVDVSDALLPPSTPANNSGIPSKHPETPMADSPQEMRPNWSSIATPRPPGAWMATPAPARRSRANSLPAQADPDESSKSSMGLATPTASLGRASSVIFQTPAPPGAYIPTPAARKSILRVRFDQVASSANGTDVAAGESFEHTSGLDMHKSEDTMLASTSPPRSPGQPRIRVLDAFGRPQTSNKGGETALSPRKTPVRIVDATGQEIEEPSVQYSQTEDEDEEPRTHNDALKRVRHDVQSLHQQFHDMEVKREESSEDLQRLRHLEQVSRESREKRDRLAQDLQSRELDFKAKFAQQRDSMEKSRLTMASTPLSRPSLWTPKVWMSLLALQLFVAVFIYKYMHMRAEELFLTTYYDTFYGDLYISDTPNSARYAIPSRVSWFHQQHQDGWMSYISNFWQYLCLFIMDVQSHVRDRWLRREPSLSWSPT